MEKKAEVFDREVAARKSAVAAYDALAVKHHAVPKPNIQPDFNVSVFECFDTISSAGL